MVLYLYDLRARTDAIPILKTALKALDTAMAVVPGYGGSEVLRQHGDENRIVVLERWTSIEAHDAGSSAVPADIMRTMRESLAEKPVQSILTDAES